MTDELVKEMARAAFAEEFGEASFDAPDTSDFERGTYLIQQRAALAALIREVPALDNGALEALVKGEAVVVPREATGEMRVAGSSKKVNVFAGGAYDIGRVASNDDDGDAGDTGTIYTAMLAASPYRSKSDE